MPQPDGKLLLAMRHHDRDALFSVDPATRTFRALGERRCDESLSQLALVPLILSGALAAIAALSFVAARHQLETPRNLSSPPKTPDAQAPSAGRLPRGSADTDTQ